MTDQPGPPPEQLPEPAPEEERLPATRPQETMPAERFTAPPPVKAIAGLTPARSASIVRQSGSARWVGFLTVIFVSLFIVGYWFYELGAPLGLSTRSRSPTSSEATTCSRRTVPAAMGRAALGPTSPTRPRSATSGPS